MLAEAVTQGQYLRFTYTDQRGKVSERRVLPYRHVLREGIWYLIAYDTQRTGWRLFRLDRIRYAAPEPTPTGVDLPEFPSASIEDWLTTDFGRLRTHDH